MKQVSFASVPVGSEFYWGAYRDSDMNWGKKRSSRTADWKPRILGKLSAYVSIGYWKQTESVFIEDSES